jgi:hypothetical protein
MPGQATIQNVSYKSSGAAIRNNRFVVQVAAETCKEADTAGMACDGVSQGFIANPNANGVNEITLPKAIPVMDRGIAWVVAGAALATIGVQIATDNQGRAVAAVSTNVVVGVLRSVSGAAGDLVLVDLDVAGHSIKA